MTNQNLTKAFIKKKTKRFGLKISLSESEMKDSPYFLIIKSSSPKCTRLTIYPIKRDKIIKISILAHNISDFMIEELSNILKKYEIIHTSGLLVKKKELNYECYLDLDFSNPKSKDLKSSLNKLKNILKEIIIEEISLKRFKKSKL
ncbi:MAG: hypothetical protein ACTSQP_14760 [Promethearchaeota archaeon]